MYNIDIPCPIYDLEALLEWTANNNGASVKCLRSNKFFEGAVIFPTVCQVAFTHSHKVVMFDGAHLSTTFGGNLLLATTVDPDEATIVIWAIVRTESKATWRWFFEHIHTQLLDALNEEGEEGLAIILDRQKGLKPAVTEFFPNAWHYWCTQHLAANVGSLYT
jgi:hypothetical protein